MAVAAAVPMVEVQRDAIGHRQWFAPSTHIPGWLQLNSNKDSADV